MSAYDLLPCTHVKHISDSKCYYAHARLRLEAKMIRGLIRSLKQEGFKPVCVFDGGEYIDVKNETQTLDAVFAVDEATITFEGKNGTHHKVERYGVLVVIGNGVDCICDYNVDRDPDSTWNVVIERITDELYSMHETDYAA